MQPVRRTLVVILGCSYGGAGGDNWSNLSAPAPRLSKYGAMTADQDYRPTPVRLP